MRLNLFTKFLRMVLPYKRKWLAILILSGAAALFGLVNPYLTKLVIDDAIAKKDIRAFVVFAAIGVGVFVLIALLNGIKNYLDEYIRLRVNFDLNKRIFERMQNFRLRWFQDRSTGENIYRISEDVERVADFITTTPPEALFIFPKVLFTLAMVFYLNWKMALISLFLAPLLFLPPYYFSRKMKRVWEILIANSEGVYQHLEETFSHIQLIKAFGKETASIRKFLKLMVNNVKIGVRKIRLEMLSTFTSDGLSKVIIALITFYGGYQVIEGRFTLGGLVALMVYLRQLVGLQSQFAAFFQTTVVGLVSCGRVDEILDEGQEIVEAGNAKGVIFNKGSVLFKDVSFGYRDGEHVLRDLSFEIEGGSNIALVAPSGSGKTTIALMLLRLYDPWKGRIFIDGHDLRDLKFGSLKGQIGVALQEPHLWNDSIENNIRYAKEDATGDEIIRAAQMTMVDDFVRDLPEKYGTVIGENACRLSEGQKQKIALARALVKRPRILILDEAMSSMDSASEERILKNIRKELNNVTIITISHRLSTVLNADLVYYFSRPSRMIINNALELHHSEDFLNLFAGQGKISYIAGEEAINV